MNRFTRTFCPGSSRRREEVECIWFRSNPPPYVGGCLELASFGKSLWKLFVAVCVCIHVCVQAGESPFRPPAVPLVACDPYFSIWSQADKLTDVNTTHWTGRAHRLTSMLRIDGKPFRLMGRDIASAPPLPQTALEVLP